MKIELTHRRLGVHSLVRNAEIPGDLADYATPLPLPRIRSDEYAVDEDKLIAALPNGFMPSAPTGKVLLAVSDESGGTGQTGLSRFRDWAKYFDAYTLNIYKDEATR